MIVKRDEVRAYCNLVHDASATSRLAKDCDSVWVSTEEMDVLLYPLQGKALIVQTCVCGAVLLKGRSAQPAKCSESVVHRDVDDTSIVVDFTAKDQSGRTTGVGLGARSVARTKY